LTLVIDNREIATDKQGYLQHLSDWNEQIAVAIAAAENIALTAEHWLIIHFLRNFYQEFQTTPPIRILVKEIEKKFGTEKGNSIYLHQLFPGGPAKQACKIAGLPKPVKCI
jgi:tRNA 2-thiouridine synthesizing protein E